MWTMNSLIIEAAIVVVYANRMGNIHNSLPCYVVSAKTKLLSSRLENCNRGVASSACLTMLTDLNLY